MGRRARGRNNFDPKFNSNKKGLCNATYIYFMTNKTCPFCNSNKKEIFLQITLLFFALSFSVKALRERAAIHLTLSNLCELNFFSFVTNNAQPNYESLSNLS